MAFGDVGATDEQLATIAEQRARITELEKELALWHRGANTHQELLDEVNNAHDINSRVHGLLKGMTKRAETAEADNAKLRDYAGHMPGCPGEDWPRHPERGCSCGWVTVEPALGKGGEESGG